MGVIQWQPKLRCRGGYSTCHFQDGCAAGGLTGRSAGFSTTICGGKGVQPPQVSPWVLPVLGRLRTVQVWGPVWCPPLPSVTVVAPATTGLAVLLPASGAAVAASGEKAGSSQDVPEKMDAVLMADAAKMRDLHVL